MIETTIAELRSRSELFRSNEVIHLHDGRKREPIGYFVPERYAGLIEEAVATVERERRLGLLKRVAAAQAKDPIEEGGAGDGLESR
ncbi:MAG: hypothetical protein AB7E49_02290 [Campylobacterales bacterium]